MTGEITLLNNRDQDIIFWSFIIPAKSTQSFQFIQPAAIACIVFTLGSGTAKYGIFSVSCSTSDSKIVTKELVAPSGNITFTPASTTRKLTIDNADTGQLILKWMFAGNNLNHIPTVL